MVIGFLLGSGCQPNSADISNGIKDPNALFPILKNGKWGYMNRSGHLVIDPQFERAISFAEGLAPVKKNGKWGYIDPNGTIVIQPQYAAVLPFSEGIALVSFDDWATNEPYKMFYLSRDDMHGGNTAAGGWAGMMKDAPSLEDDGFNAGGREEGLRFAYIDKQGHVIFSSAMDYAFSFHDGLASVSIHKRVSFLNSSGTIVLQTSFNLAGSFSEGLAKVSEQKTDRWGQIYSLWGYVDKSGHTVIAPQFISASNFSEGLAGVVVDNQDVRDAMHQRRLATQGQTGIIDLGPVPIQYIQYIDHSGNLAFHTNSFQASPFHEGLACLQAANIFVDLNGKQVVGCGKSKTCIGSFSGGLALFLEPVSRKAGFINKSGDVAIPPKFDDVESFHNGLALVRSGGKFVTKDVEGQYVDRMGSRYIGAQIGYIDASGKYVWKPTD